jgi:hypothetical protein
MITAVLTEAEAVFPENDSSKAFATVLHLQPPTLEEIADA